MYAVTEMPATIDETLEVASERYGVTVPLADLLYSDLYSTLITKAQTGQYLGLHRAGEHTCHHLAFAQDAVDWEIWIEAGEKPLPRKVVINYKQQPATPRYVATLHRWDVAPKFATGFFDLKPSVHDKKIEMLPVVPAGPS